MDSARAGSRIRVLIVDDHPMLRAGVAAVIASQDDMEVVGEAASGREAMEKAATLQPDVILMDLNMPGLNGVDAIAAIVGQAKPRARIIVLTTYTGDAQALRALQAGAVAFLLKSSLRSELLDTIRAVHAGRRHLQPEVAAEIALHATREPLTRREVEILRLVAQGESNKRVAWRLQISEETVKTHLRSTFAKLDVSDRTHAVVVAAKRGLIDL